MFGLINSFSDLFSFSFLSSLLLYSSLLYIIFLFYLYLFYNEIFSSSSSRQYKLPDGTIIYSGFSSSSDVLAAYFEIFVEKNYWHYGIKLNENKNKNDKYTIFDCGANNGIFVLYLNQLAKNLKRNFEVHAFEPIKDTFNILSKNTNLHTKNNSLIDVKLNHCGCSKQTISNIIFDYSPSMSIASSMHGNELYNHLNQITPKQWVKTVLHDSCLLLLRKQSTTICSIILTLFSNPIISTILTILFFVPVYCLLIHAFIHDKLFKRQVPCSLVTLSEYIENNKIKHIDLMKIDVEGSEEDVINGLNKYVNICDQYVIEVHDVNNERLNRMKQLFESNGFHVYIEQEKWEIHKLLKIFTLFARRKNLDY